MIATILLLFAASPADQPTSTPTELTQPATVTPAPQINISQSCIYAAGQMFEMIRSPNFQAGLAWTQQQAGAGYAYWQTLTTNQKVSCGIFLIWYFSHSSGCNCR